MIHCDHNKFNVRTGGHNWGLIWTRCCISRGLFQIEIFLLQIEVRFFQIDADLVQIGAIIMDRHIL